MMRRLSLLTFLLMLVQAVAWAQGIRITGKVVSSEDNEPIVGASILVKGTTNGTVTDVNGNYSLEISSGSETLIFSFVGYERQEIVPGNQSTLNVTLVPEVTALSEVVVTAFGIKQERKALGYSVQEVNSKLITETNQPNALNALRGRVAGVSITSSSGAPGAGSAIVIRGINSLDPGADNQPLFVIDGIPISNETNITGGRGGSNFTNSNRFADINPDDIESMSILKGPAASALYGLRAANGAVIITTKSGKSGKTTFNYRTTYSFDDVVKRPPMQDKYSRGFNGIYNPTDYRSDGPPLPADAPRYDQWDQIFNTGHQAQHALSFSGGNEAATFYGSLSRLDQVGVVPNSFYDRTTAKIAGSLQASERLRLDGSASYINSHTTNPRQGVGGVGVISYASRYSPEVDMNNYINADGTPIRYSTQLENPFFFAENAYQKEQLDRFIGNFGASYKFTDWLNASYRVGVDQYSESRFRVAAPSTLIGAGGNGSIDEQSLTYQEINSNFLLNFQKEIATDVNLTASVGNQVTMINSTNINSSGSNFVIPSFNSINNLSLYTVRTSPTERNIIGVFADIKLDYKQILFLNATGRNDWSSTLPEANRSFFYPSISGAFVFTEMLGLADNPWLNFGKVRLSYAEVGKDASPYLIGNYYSTLTPFRGIVGVDRNSVIGSETLRPERTKGVEMGVDLSFLRNRIRVDANYAIQRSIDQIVPIPVSRATGFTNFVANAGEIENRAIELLVDATVVRTRNFRWNTIINWSRIRGKVVAMPEGVDVITFQPETPWVKQRIQTGGRPGDWYGWTLSRVETEGSSSLGRLIIGANGYPDVNNNWRGVPLAQDTYIGNAFPEWEGGWNNSISYKNFELSFLFTFRKGGYVFDINRRMRYGQAGGEAPTGAETEIRNRLVVFDGVTNTGTIENPVWVENTLPVEIGVSTLYGQAFRYRLAKEFNGFQEASWIRLQNVSLSYSLPKSLLDKLPFTNVTASVTGNNLWLTTPFIGFDPEQSAYGPGSNVFGYVGTNTPATRSIYFGLNLGF